jgi:glycosyltransferase involved in cell wall biosynthesis
METVPIVSVIIPNFDNACYLSQCIDSVLGQTVKDIEIVISDDCSADGSREIIAGYASRDRRVKAIYNDMRLQVSANRHHAIMASSADYITTLDSDDYYCDEHKIEKELELIVQHRDRMNEEICAYSNILLIDENGKITGKQWQDECIRQGDLFMGIFSRTCSIPRDFTFSRSLYIMSGGYDPAFNLYEDWDLKIRMSRIVSFYFTGINGIAYRKKGSGLSYAPYEQHADAIRKIYKKNEGLISPAEKGCIQRGLSGYLHT